MSITLTPDAETGDIIARQIANGRFATPEEVVRAGLRLLERQEAEIEELRRLIDEGDAAIVRGDVKTYASGVELLADVKQLGEARSRNEPCE